MDKIKKQVEEKIKEISEEGIQEDNLKYLTELVDIHKDIENEEYWKTKKEVMEMNYRGYGEYGEEYSRRGVPGSGRGRGRRYSARGGRGGSYQGEEMIEEMKEHYGNYSEGKEQFNRGNYGAESATMKSLEYMLESVVEFIKMLEEEAESQEEVKLIKHYTKKISEM